MTYTINTNPEFNSLEIFFDEKPSEMIRDALKALKFRWHNVKKCWYGYTDKESAEEAIRAAGSTEEQQPEPFKAFTVHSDGYLGAVEVTGNNVGKFDYTSDCFKKAFRACGISGVTVRKESFSGGMNFDFTVTFDRKDVKTLEEYQNEYIDDELFDVLPFISYIEDGKCKDITSEQYSALSEDEQEKITLGNLELKYNRALEGSHHGLHGYDPKRTVLKKCGEERLYKINGIIRSFWHDDSNGMVDYFDTNFYYDFIFKIKD